jgi:hypothetical protein
LKDKITYPLKADEREGPDSEQTLLQLKDKITYRLRR